MSTLVQGNVELLESVELLDGLDRDALQSLASEARWQKVPAGEEVIHEGDPSTSVVLVVRGRLRVVRRSADEDSWGAVIGAGQPVGELGWLLEEPRSASAVAVRESLVAEIDREALERVISTHPAALLALSKRIAARLVTASADDTEEPGSTLLVDTSNTGADLWQRLHSELDALGAIGLTHDELVSATGVVKPEPIQAARWLEDRVRGGDLVVVSAQAESARELVPLFDRVVLMCGPTDSPGADPVSAHLVELLARAIPVTLEMVLLDGPHGTSTPVAPWLEALAPQAHHRVRPDRPNDVARLARRLTRRSTALALGGGGARAFAHIGALRALHDAGLEVDSVTGSGFGAVIGAQVAAGWSPDEMLEENAGAWRRLGMDIDLPFVSLLGGRAMRLVLERMFGDSRIEDLPIDFRCLTTDLSWLRPEIHTSGQLALWLRASASLPGIHPPVVHDGRLHVDGGLVEHVPVRPALSTNPGTVIAVDPSPFRPLPITELIEEAPSGLRYLLQQIPLVGSGFPGIGSLLYRSFTLHQHLLQDERRRRVDLYIEPPVDRFRVVDYRRVRQLAEFGYEETARRLERDGHLVGL